jgi:hypothetical protein
LSALEEFKTLGLLVDVIKGERERERERESRCGLIRLDWQYYYIHAANQTVSIILYHKP